MTGRIRLRKPRGWALATGLLLTVPAAVLFSLNTRETGEVLLEQLTVTVVAGVLLTGAGSVLRAAVHGGSKVADGVGKLLGVTGWGISLTAAVTFAIQRIGFEDRGEVIGLTIGGTLVVAGLTIVWSFVEWQPKAVR